MATLIVDDNNNGDFSTIEEAVAAAAAGDTIDITGGNDGVHNETNILIDKDLIITSSSNATIDAEGAGRIFTIDDGNADNQIEVEVNNLILTGGSADDGIEGRSDADNGGAIFNRESLIVDNIRATKNFADSFGGVIYTEDGGKAVITKSVFNNNTSGGSDRSATVTTSPSSGGGAIAAINGSIEIKESNFTDNIAFRFGGAILVNDSSTLTIERSGISGNIAAIVAGGIFSNDSQTTITEVTIDNNAAQFSGGIHNEFGSELTAVRSSISNNLTLFGASGVFNLFDSQFTATETSIQGNRMVDELPLFGQGFVEQSSSGIGGGIYNLVDSSVSLINSNVTNNETELGGGIANTEGTIDIQNSQVSNNTSTFSDFIEASNVFFDPNITEFQNDIRADGDGSQNLIGTPENDQIVGGGGSDTLDGGAGLNILRGNLAPDTIDNGATDTFVLTAESAFNILENFVDGQDLIALRGGIGFYDLTFSGSIISFNDTPIALVNDVDTTTLTSDDFVTL